MKSNDRLKKINNLVESIKPQNKWINEQSDKSSQLLIKYNKELENYKFVKDKSSLKKCKMGGCIRYVNPKNEIRYGGILLKIYQPPDKDVTMLLLQNTNMQKWSITWERNIIFYKEQVKKGDNLRNIFISLLNNDNN